MRARWLVAIAIVALAARATAQGDSARAMPELPDASAFLAYADQITGTVPGSRCVTQASISEDTVSPTEPDALDRPTIVHGRVLGTGGIPPESVYVGFSSFDAPRVVHPDGSYEIAIPRDRLADPMHTEIVASGLGMDMLSHPITLRPGTSVTANFMLCPYRWPASPEDVRVPVYQDASPEVVAPSIVGRSGRFVVILRRGRLFTVRMRARSLELADAVRAFRQGADPQFYSMLVRGDRIVVLWAGARSETEIALFRIDPHGRLRFNGEYEWATAFASQNSWNYVRLVGDRLVFYYAMRTGWWVSTPLDVAPVLRRRQDADTSRFDTLIVPKRLFRPQWAWGPTDSYTLHVAATCDLARPRFECRATVVIAPPLAMHNISRTAVYVLTADPSRADTSRRSSMMDSAGSLLIRIPLDGSAPGAIGVAGTPMDLSTFLERDRRVHLVVRANWTGPTYWAPAGVPRSTALLTVPITDFRDGSASAPYWRYRPLPTGVGEIGWTIFAAGKSVYVAAAPVVPEIPGTVDAVYVAPLNGGEVTRVPMPSGAWQIAPMGRGAATIYANGKTFDVTGIRVDSAPRAVQRFSILTDREHAPWTEGSAYIPLSADSGILGVYVVGTGVFSRSKLTEGPGAILLLLNDGRRLLPLGTLTAAPDPPITKDCEAACMSSHPRMRLFAVDGRIFAMLGYDLIEIRVRHGKLQELRRVRFTLRGPTDSAELRSQ